MVGDGALKGILVVVEIVIGMVVSVGLLVLLGGKFSKWLKLDDQMDFTEKENEK